METQRLKSIDSFRGLCMTWMVLTHLIDWWLISDFDWLHGATVMILDPIGASGFLFISGVSIALSYRRRLMVVNVSENYNLKTMRNSYILRAFCVFFIAIMYNSFIAIALKDPSWIWTWFVLLTAAVSLFIAWPLLKTSRLFRIIIGVIFWIAHQIFVIILLPYEGTLNLNGVLFHFLYHNIHQDPILVFFPFFLFGTVLGDTLFNTMFSDQSEKENKKTFLRKYLKPTAVIGLILIIFGILLDFPAFLFRQSLSWTIYSLGIDILLLSLLLYIEKFNLIQVKKSYKFLFYYSYYSLTIYLAHNLLYFVLLEKLNAITIWIAVIIAYFLLTLLFRMIYKKLHSRASLKSQIGRISLILARKLEKS
ncbi:MAG: acyltransferase family protein [Promethearchaeota archaeon]|jgi:uncharacterized membrane protein